VMNGTSIALVEESVDRCMYQKRDFVEQLFISYYVILHNSFPLLGFS